MKKLKKKLLNSPWLKSEEASRDAVRKAKSKRELLNVLIEMCSSQDEDIQYMGVTLLCKIKREWATYFVIRVMSDTTQGAWVRSKAINGLGWMGNHTPSLVPTFIDIAKKETDEDVLYSLLESLAFYLWDSTLVSAQAGDYLIEQVGNPALPDTLRALAAEGLGLADKRTPQSLRKRIVATLIQALPDPAPCVRFYAVRALGWIGDAKASPFLQSLTTDAAYGHIGGDGGTVMSEVTRAQISILSRRAKQARKA